MNNDTNIDFVCSDVCYEEKGTPIEGEKVRERNKNYATINYCKSECEYYTSCCANFDCCLQKMFEEVLGSLTEREENVLKLSFGFAELSKSLEEIGELYGVTADRIRQIQAKALRKLRHPSRSKKIKPFLFDVFSIQNDNFYNRLISALFNFERADLLEYKLGIDFEIVDKEQNAERSLAQIKRELDTPINEIASLQPYVVYISKYEFANLKQLLRATSNQLNLRVFANDDTKFFEFINTIHEMGYRFKFFRPEDIVAKELSDELKLLIVDPQIYSQQVLDLSLATTLKLLEHKIISVEDLVKRINSLKGARCLPIEMQTEIDRFLLSNGLALMTEEGKMLYLSRNNLNAFSERFVWWMIQNKHSMNSLLLEFKKASIDSLKVIEYIYKTFPASIDYISPEFTIDSIDDLDLCLRTYNCLMRVDINTVEKLIKLSREELLAIPHLGRMSLEELVEKLEALGLLKYCKWHYDESDDLQE